MSLNAAFPVVGLAPAIFAAGGLGAPDGAFDAADIATTADPNVSRYCSAFDGFGTGGGGTPDPASGTGTYFPGDFRLFGFPLSLEQRKTIFDRWPPYLLATLNDKLRNLHHDEPYRSIERIKQFIVWLLQYDQGAIPEERFDWESAIEDFAASMEDPAILPDVTAIEDMFLFLESLRGRKGAWWTLSQFYKGLMYRLETEPTDSGVALYCRLLKTLPVRDFNIIENACDFYIFGTESHHVNLSLEQRLLVFASLLEICVAHARDGDTYLLNELFLTVRENREDELAAPRITQRVPRGGELLEECWRRLSEAVGGGA